MTRIGSRAGSRPEAQRTTTTENNKSISNSNDRRHGRPVYWAARKDYLMRISRASLRVSLFGGGTDLPSYYEREGATIISFALDRSIYVSINERPTGGCRLSYSEVEELTSLQEAQHSLVARAALEWGFKEPCTMTIVSDLPKGTGLGSSSALTVALRKLSRIGLVSPTTPFMLEQMVNPNVGQQDSLPALYGGLRTYKISRAGDVMASDDQVSRSTLISNHGVLLYTGLSRPAAPILKNWSNDVSHLHDIHDLASDYAYSEWTLQSLGEGLHESWEIKSGIDGVSTYELDEQYRMAKNAGAIGGKICGAGAGGCWFFVTEDKKSLVKAMGLRQIPFSVARVGNRVVRV